MYYEISVTKPVQAPDPEIYINPCCFGGDVVAAQLLPIVQQRYESVDSNQEDWGWYIWFKSGDISLAVDICCDDPDTGEFRLLLYANRKRFLRKDIPEPEKLEELRALIVPALEQWAGAPVGVQLENAP